MPTYLYRREDGSTFEIEQRITEPALTTCPTTNQPVTRLISPGAGLVFKGSGFYLTDYARAGDKGDASKKKAATGSNASKDKSSTKSSSGDDPTSGKTTSVNSKSDGGNKSSKSD